MAEIEKKIPVTTELIEYVEKGLHDGLKVILGENKLSDIKKIEITNQPTIVMSREVLEEYVALGMRNRFNKNADKKVVQFTDKLLESGHENKKKEESAGQRVLRIMKYMGTDVYLKTMADISKILYTEQCMSVLKVVWNTMENTGRNFIVRIHAVEEGVMIIQIQEEDAGRRIIRPYLCIECMNFRGDMMSELNIGKEDLNRLNVDPVELLELEFIINEFLSCITIGCYMTINDKKLGELLIRQYNRFDTVW